MQRSMHLRFHRMQQQLDESRFKATGGSGFLDLYLDRLGNLRSTSATVDENVTSKYNLSLSKVFRDYLVSLTSYNVGEVS